MEQPAITHQNVERKLVAVIAQNWMTAFGVRVKVYARVDIFMVLATVAQIGGGSNAKSKDFTRFLDLVD
eukprot:CAMPEP_0168551972 /NCGR_PEP_ID=MMETSP0413-20121227/6465_1 /TAXON_ID=136452 /ORGANISM="Filamoeba nolandi, Strain NC-AS-23-1" /LENGTH=68 /DNA_ID=CAMNT_0008582549 /DNA_START=166 /DNA_END=372 /DNA_ORIENTATION=+